jgi:hypothetical protein
MKIARPDRRLSAIYRGNVVPRAAGVGSLSAKRGLQPVLCPERRLPLLPAGHDVEALLSTLAKALEPVPAKLRQLDEVAVRVSHRRHAQSAGLLRLVEGLDAPLCQGLEVASRSKTMKASLTAPTPTLWSRWHFSRG